MVPVCRKNRYDIFDPFPIIGMFQSVNMRKDVWVMAVRFLVAGSVGMRYLVVLRFKRVWQVSNLLLPYRCEYLIVGPELVDPYESSSELTGLAMIDQHPVAEKFPADRGAVRINYADYSGAVWILPGKYAPLRWSILSVILHFFKCIGKIVSKLWQHVRLEEFIGNSIPAEIIMVSNLSLHFNELPKTRAAFPATIALKLDHSKINFIPIMVI